MGIEHEESGLCEALIMSKTEHRPTVSITEKEYLWHSHLGHSTIGLTNKTIPIVNRIGLKNKSTRS